MKSKFALIYFDAMFLISVVFCLMQYVHADASCRTPKDEPGECIPLQECTPLYDIIRYKRPLTWTDVNFLRKSHCGFDGNVTKVCCSPFFTGSIFQSSISPEFIDSLFQPPSSTNVPTTKEPISSLKPFSTNAPTTQEPTKAPLLQPLITSKKPFSANALTTQLPNTSQKLSSTNTPTTQPSNASQKPFTTTKPLIQEDGLGDNYTSNLLPDHTVCGTVTNNEIYRGHRTTLDEFPWMALIEYEKRDKSRSFECTGALISKRYVLTIARCMTTETTSRVGKLVSVRLGEYDKATVVDCDDKTKECRKEPALDVPVEESIPHEQYNQYDLNKYHDIGLLRLNRDVQITDFIKPICLPLAKEIREKTYTGSKLTVAGWGITNQGSPSNIKIKLQISGKSQNDCNSIYSAAGMVIGENQLCAGGEGRENSCRGDSGGPLMTLFTDEIGDTNWYTAGIVSFGFGPACGEGWPVVHTRVSKYVSWIVRKIR